MKLDLVFRNTSKNTVLNRVFFERIIEKALSIAQISSPKIELSINIVGLKRITDLNKKHRGKNKPTDVLSFPVQKDLISTKPHPGGIMNLGDIFISYPFVVREVGTDNKKIKNQIILLTVHGLLHLLEYDHERSSKNEKQMFALQDKIVRSL
ncbi:MAG: rRNA maturation RNase YbeY [Parcubacteria group bacterium]